MNIVSNQDYLRNSVNTNLITFREKTIVTIKFKNGKMIKISKDMNIKDIEEICMKKLE